MTETLEVVPRQWKVVREKIHLPGLRGDFASAGLSNNAAECELRSIALDRKLWLFAGSDRGGERAAIMYSLIQIAA